MSGISFSPVGGFMGGMREARREREAAEDRRRQQELDNLRRQQSELYLQQQQMALDEHKAGQSIRDMQRKSQEAAMLSQHALQAIDYIPDEHLSAFVADYLTRLPIGGAVEVHNGKMVDLKTGEARPFTGDRQKIKELFLRFARPEVFYDQLQQEMAPKKYVDAEGRVTTMKPSEARGLNLRAYDDVGSEYTLQKAKLAPEVLQTEMAKIRHDMALGSAREARERDRLALDKQIALMGGGKRSRGLDGQAGGWGYEFSKQSEAQAYDYAMRTTMRKLGYREQKDPVTGQESWIGPGGQQATHEELEAADFVGMRANEYLASGRAFSITEAQALAEADLDAHQKHKNAENMKMRHEGAPSAFDSPVLSGLRQFSGQDEIGPDYISPKMEEEILSKSWVGRDGKRYVYGPNNEVFEVIK